MKILILNGPNLQLLGTRKTDVYGCSTLNDVESQLKHVAKSIDIELLFSQSNHEGDIVDRIALALKESIDGIIINPAAYTHTSIAIRDAIEAVQIPTIEIHISNIHCRESFRETSIIAPVCLGQICGLGVEGYEWAMRALIRHLNS